MNVNANATHSLMHPLTGPHGHEQLIPSSLPTRRSHNFTVQSYSRLSVILTVSCGNEYLYSHLRTIHFAALGL